MKPGEQAAFDALVARVDALEAKVSALTKRAAPRKTAAKKKGKTDGKA